MKKQLVFSTILFCLSQNLTVIQAQKPSNMSAVYGKSGRFEIFVGISEDDNFHNGGVYHTWQTLKGGEWNSAWTVYSPSPEDKPHSIVAGKDGNGRIIVAWINDGNIYVAAARYTDASLVHSPEPTFRPVGEADGHVYKYTYLTITDNPDGMIEILALNERGRVYSFKEAKQDESKSYWTWQDSFTQPHLIGGGDLLNISVTKFNGRLGLIGTGKDGKVYFKNQTVPGTWDIDPWINLQGNQIREAYAQESKAHQLEVVALGSDQSLYLNFQNAGTTSFSGWQMLLSQQTNGKFAPAIFFERSKNGSLFVVSHKDVSSITQYLGSFGKAFQGPNNGEWTGTFYTYSAVTTHQTGINTVDDLGFLSPNAFAVVADAKGAIHYFACFRGLPRVEHYVDYFVASSRRSLAYEHREHEIPDFPWQYNKE